MEKSEINWKGGEVTSWDIDDLDLSKIIDSQIDLLKEDLAQVWFGKDIVLDLGWHPEFNPQGQFVLSVVKLTDGNSPKGEGWESPILQIKFRDMAKFTQNLEQAIEIADRRKTVNQ